MICDQLDFVYIAVGEMLLVNMPVMQGRLHTQLGCYDDACNLETHTSNREKGKRRTTNRWYVKLEEGLR